MKKEYSIMPHNYLYQTERYSGSERHEVFGAANRKKSIEYGLVIFLSPLNHRDNKIGIHSDKTFRLKVQQIGQKAYMEHYDKTIEEFIEKFGKNYL